MPKYQVLVTGSTYIEVEADNPNHAEEIAKRDFQERRMGVWDMDLEFVCEEQDLLGEDDGV